MERINEVSALVDHGTTIFGTPVEKPRKRARTCLRRQVSKLRARAQAVFVDRRYEQPDELGRFTTDYGETITVLAEGFDWEAWAAKNVRTIREWQQTYITCWYDCPQCDGAFL